ncbi:hypothetical protein [Yinghuangia seranimata]|uniref:hypothetical protein n=1 Tax=Yinghuangia seranimata TaxID=408067 RepID=UPI00248C6AC5|nr:hypothetical protein [Yinghuangia seranimata]MDI2127304.1 hypothetical protein [Yinghuangia seranimata]
MKTRKVVATALLALGAAAVPSAAHADAAPLLPVPLELPDLPAVGLPDLPEVSALPDLSALPELPQVHELGDLAGVGELARVGEISALPAASELPAVSAVPGVTRLEAVPETLSSLDLAQLPEPQLPEARLPHVNVPQVPDIPSLTELYGSGQTTFSDLGRTGSKISSVPRNMEAMQTPEFWADATQNYPATYAGTVN